MKNMLTAAIVAATVLSLAACHPPHGESKSPDSASTTVKIDSSTKTTAVDDTAITDTVKVAASKTEVKTHGGDGGNPTSMRALKDSFKKDSAKLSRK